MKNKTRLPIAGAAILAAMAAAAQVNAPKPASVPHLEKRGNATQLIVDGRPYLALAAELANSASSNMEYLEPYWSRLVASHVNTVLVAVSWELIEPEPGKFDFSLVDGVIRDARKHNLRLMLLWFGSWKNSMSTYAPPWVKKDTKQYPLLVDENGNSLNMMSVFYEANWKADANAYRELMRHVREVDGKDQTVLMMQIENEVGIRGTFRDHAPEAEKALKGPVPKELMEYLAKNRDSLIPEIRQQWAANGNKTSGTWREVFGSDRRGDGIFMSWYYARYMDRVAGAGKAEYPIPTFVNAALGDWVGQYSSGAALADTLNIWQAAAPNIDILSPCIYRPVFSQWAALFHRAGNPLFIPETRPDPGYAVWAFGQHDLIGFSPFAYERSADGNTPLARAYDVLGQLAPLILEGQSKGTIRAAVLDPDKPSESVELGGYTFELKRGRGPGAPPADQQAPGQPGGRRGAQAGAQQAGGGRGQAGVPPEQASFASTTGYAMFISTGPDEFIIMGSGAQITFHPNTPGPKTASIATLEEGRYVDGRWVPGRRLNGDDTSLEYSLGEQAKLNQSGQGLRFGSDPSIVHIAIYRY
jgi:hypothetical protein